MERKKGVEKLEGVVNNVLQGRRQAAISGNAVMRSIKTSDIERIYTQQGYSGSFICYWITDHDGEIL